MTTHDEKTAVATVIENWSKAISNKNAAQVLSYLADDVVQFTLAPPLRQDEEDLQGWFDTWDGSIGIESRDTAISAGSDVAFATSLVRMTGQKTDGEMPDLWFRQTIGLIKQNGTWKIAHEHASVPFYMDGSFKAAIDLKP
ncbi:YybH family protein [Phyllobacterium bourgognense]|uniref:Ketosteroid isomerase-like protein n=1 Tax=Phyllobacterium bourgognense TaxID=314236 RepID=A0A368YHR7_9HYPH|nr:nuclear transport factor 2 family protein [Phyllobacterium bourgognense]RCW79780.1 ketosteroid isomerase-like protein [Phyllobacterium bourgognense]